MDIAGQIAEAYRALQKPPGSVTRLSTGTLCFMYTRLYITRSPGTLGSDQISLSKSQPTMNAAPASRPDTSTNSPAAQCIQTACLRPARSATRLSPPVLVSMPGGSPRPGRQRISVPAARLAGPSQEHPPTTAGSSHEQPSVMPCTHAGVLTPTGRSTGWS